MVYYPKEVSKLRIDFTKYSIARGPNFMIFYVMAMILLMAAALIVNMFLGIN